MNKVDIFFLVLGQLFAMSMTGIHIFQYPYNAKTKKEVIIDILWTLSGIIAFTFMICITVYTEARSFRKWWNNLD